MPLRLHQLLAALLLLVGLIIALTWHYWADAPLWLLLVGGTLTLTGIVLAVTAMAARMEMEEARE